MKPSRLCRFLILLGSLVGTMCQAADRPNILLIVSDDQGYNDLGTLEKAIRKLYL